MGIIDEEVAFAFDMQCAETLYEDEVERQKTMMEAGMVNQLPPELQVKGPRRIRQ